MSPPAVPPRHYPTPSAKCADLVVHVVGLTLALVGGIVLLTLAVRAQSLSMAFAVGIYALGLLAMLGFSTAYNFAKPRFRPALRRLDHAGIFLMIAGSYTPFTTQTLTGAWAWGMTVHWACTTYSRSRSAPGFRPWRHRQDRCGRARSRRRRRSPGHRPGARPHLG